MSIKFLCVTLPHMSILCRRLAAGGAVGSARRPALYGPCQRLPGARPVHGTACGELLARRGRRSLGGAAAERPGDRLRRPLLRRGHGPERARPAGGGCYPPRGGDDEAAACAGGAVNAQPSARRITGSPVQCRIPLSTVTVLRSMRFSYTPSAASTRTSAAFALRENTPTKRLPALPR